MLRIGAPNLEAVQRGVQYRKDAGPPTTACFSETRRRSNELLFRECFGKDGVPTVDRCNNGTPDSPLAPEARAINSNQFRWPPSKGDLVGLHPKTGLSRPSRPQNEIAKPIAPDDRLPGMARSADNRAASLSASIEKLLSTQSPDEGTHVLKLVVQQLGGAFPGTDSRADVCRGEACIVRTRIPVWLLERARRLAVSEQELLVAYPRCAPKDLVTAWAYARAHAAEIEAQIRETRLVDRRARR